MMDITMLNERVHALRRLKKEAEKLDESIQAIERDLKSYMEQIKTYELSGDDWTITWNMVASSRFNTAKFKEMNPDLYKEFTSMNESRRFILK